MLWLLSGKHSSWRKMLPNHPMPEYHRSNPRAVGTGCTASPAPSIRVYSVRVDEQSTLWYFNTGVQLAGRWLVTLFWAAKRASQELARGISKEITMASSCHHLGKKDDSLPAAAAAAAASAAAWFFLKPFVASVISSLVKCSSIPNAGIRCSRSSCAVMNL